MIYLSPTQVSEMFAISDRTVRRAIVDGELDYIIEQGRYRIKFEDVLKWSERKQARINKRDNDGIGRYVKEWRIPKDL